MMFGSYTGGKSRYNTGSHLDLESSSIHAGFAKNYDRLLFGAMFQGGWGQFETFNTGNIRGYGDANVYGGSLFAKIWLQNYFTLMRP